MSITNDSSAFIQSNERRLAQSKTQPFFRAGEVYALRGRANGNPCGALGACIYFRVRAVRCTPCEVDLRFTTVFNDLSGLEDQGVRYNNRTGDLIIGGDTSTVVFRGSRNRLTCVDGLQDAAAEIEGLDLSEAYGTEGDRAYCCPPERLLYATRLPASCTACECEEDVDCGPCCGPAQECGCTDGSGEGSGSGDGEDPQQGEDPPIQ